jgi:hypothetical protein
MQHHAATDFWNEYLALPREIRARADQRFSMLTPGAPPLSRSVRQGGGFDFPILGNQRKNFPARPHSPAWEATMQLCPGA